jgi:hypothetical protein
MRDAVRRNDALRRITQPHGFNKLFSVCVQHEKIGTGFTFKWDEHGVDVGLVPWFDAAFDAAFDDIFDTVFAIKGNAF